MDIRIAVVLLPAALSENMDHRKEVVGSLHMYHCNINSGYALTFSTDSMQSVVVSADKLTLRDPVKLEFSLQVSKCLTHVLQAMNIIEYEQFAEALSLSKEIINMKQQLNMCLRECFLDGVFTNADIPPEDISFNNLSTFLANASASVQEIIVNDTTTTSPSKAAAITHRSSHGKEKSMSAVAAVRLNYSHMACVYCDTPGNFEQIQVHPYVPVTMDKQVLFLCKPCRKNWVSYRQTAACLHQLVLPGEFNEEVCSVCSDSPSELVLCSSCPRSFCTLCLTKLLTQKQSDDMVVNENWRCLCCVHPVEAFRGFASTLRLSISTQNCALPLKRMLTDSAALPAPALDPQGNRKYNDNKNKNKNKSNISIVPVSSIATHKSQTLQHSSNSKDTKRKRRTPVKNIDYITLDDAVEVEDEEEEEEEERWAEKVHCTRAARPSKKKIDNSAQKTARRNCSPPPAKASKKGSTVIPPSVSSSSSSSSSSVVEAKTDLPPVNTDLDEVHYFSKYVLDEDEIVDEEGNTNSVSVTTTEDSCFLCKDGGDLIECDYGRKGPTKGKCVVGCKKVYHEYCLGYAIPDEQKVWVCVRHYCAMCGSLDLAYQCRSCPLSCCRGCFVAWNHKNHFTEFAEHSHGLPTTAIKHRIGGPRKFKRKKQKQTKVVMSITCGTCLSMYGKSFERELLSPQSCQMGSVRQVSDVQQQETAHSPLSGVASDPVLSTVSTKSSSTTTTRSTRRSISSPPTLPPAHSDSTKTSSEVEPRTVSSPSCDGLSLPPHPLPPAEVCNAILSPLSNTSTTTSTPPTAAVIDLVSSDTDP